jgi:predicted ATPase
MENPMQIESLHIQGYKALVDVTLPLQPLSVMIGPNGCGKTSVLEVFQLLKAGVDGNLQQFITDAGGINFLLAKQFNAPTNIQIGYKTTDSIYGEVEYKFSLRPLGIGYQVASEELISKASSWLNNQPSGTELSWKKLVQHRGKRSLDFAEVVTNSEIQKIENVPVEIRTRLKPKNILILDKFEIDQRAPVRLPQSLSPMTFPGKNGEALFSVLYNLRETRSSRRVFDQIIETLSIAFPNFSHIELPVVGAGQITLAWHDQNLTQPLYPNQLSEGTLRFLWLATLLLSPEPPPLILIDEPEISLHPELLKILAALLQDASTRTQIVVATQSADLIRWLSPEEILILDKEAGQTSVTSAADPSLNLNAWLKDYSLADLWLMGNLGGRP